MEKTLWNLIERVRESSPLVVNITNFVVMNNSANAVLAVGASPIMSHAHSEVEAMVSICGSVVVNIGTLDEYWAETMVRAAREATRLGKPWLLDPVGAGATPYRDEVLKRLMPLRPTVIRGNASEIMALARANITAATSASIAATTADFATSATPGPHPATTTSAADSATLDHLDPPPVTKGVDSTAASGEAVHAARFLNREFGSIVCVSGETDIIIDGNRDVYIHNGSTMMTRVTGLGCSCSAVLGAFIATVDIAAPLLAAAYTAPVPAPAASSAPTHTEHGKLLETVTAGAVLFAMAGEIAAETASGPGSLQVALLDKLYNITESEFAAKLRVEEHCDVV